MTRDRLQGKSAVITGGCGTLGRAMARTFVREGARVLLVDLDEPSLHAACTELGDAASYCVANVARPADAARYVQTAEQRFGGIDVLVCNAGVEGVVKDIADYPLDVFEKVMSVNVTGVFLGLKFGMPAIARRGGGSVVIMSSNSGLRGANGVSAYVASKHAVVGLMRVATLEGAPQKIRVNTVNPSPIEGRMMESLEDGFAPGAAHEVKQAILASIPAGRYGTPEEVANLVLFLASDESSYCSGGVYVIDGGRTAK
jgi:NAD(P)-dependent dehydrogenase (short-subunit alcohol dehydrogenase family)